MTILPYKDKNPHIDPSAYIAPGAVVIGDVVISARASIWFNAVIRGDVEPIVIGEGSNIQDGTVVHTCLLYTSPSLRRLQWVQHRPVSRH